MLQVLAADYDRRMAVERLLERAAQAADCDIEDFREYLQDQGDVTVEKIKAIRLAPFHSWLEVRRAA